MLVQKTIIPVLFFLSSFFGYTQKGDTTLVSVDPKSGIKTIIQFSFKEAEEGKGRMTARITDRTISKFDKTGNLFYKSHLISTLKGCIRQYANYEVFCKDQSGAYKTLKQKQGKFIVKSFDKNGKLISKKKDDYIYANWLDVTENLFHP